MYSHRPHELHVLYMGAGQSPARSQQSVYICYLLAGPMRWYQYQPVHQQPAGSGSASQQPGSQQPVQLAESREPGSPSPRTLIFICLFLMTKGTKPKYAVLRRRKKTALQHVVYMYSARLFHSVGRPCRASVIHKKIKNRLALN